MLSELWLQVAWEIFDAAPQAELHRVAGLLVYLKIFGFETESRLPLGSLRERLAAAENEAATRLAEAGSAPERILLQARSTDLREVLAAVDGALAP